jgi:uncharacterized protein (DUF58 family)
VITYLTPKLLAYAFLAAIGCLGGLALGRPEPALLGAPFLFAIVIGATLHRWPEVRSSSRVLSDRVLEGDTVQVEVDISSMAPVPRLEVMLRVPEGLKLVDGPPAVALAVAPGTPGEVKRTVRCNRWGGYRLGESLIRVRDPLGFFVSEGWSGPGSALRVYPRSEAIRTLLTPAETQVFAGNELSRMRGDGIEFADVRPFVAGDRVKRINWRLTSRQGEPYINDYHRERNADVVIFLDAFAEVRRGDAGTRFEAVRAAAALAERYLQERNRVGLISFGGILRWLHPAMGTVQRYRIVESLIETDVVFSYAWKEIAVIPPAVLPPKALVIALTPLLDERVMHALLDLRARHFDLAIIEVSPAPFIAPPRNQTDALAERIWALDREVMRERLRRLGVPVAEWKAGEPVEQPILEVQAFRRYTRLARA